MSSRSCEELSEKTFEDLNLDWVRFRQALLAASYLLAGTVLLDIKKERESWSTKW